MKQLAVFKENKIPNSFYSFVLYIVCVPMRVQVYIYIKSAVVLLKNSAL